LVTFEHQIRNILFLVTDIDVPKYTIQVYEVNPHLNPFGIILLYQLIVLFILLSSIPNLNNMLEPKLLTILLNKLIIIILILTLI